MVEEMVNICRLCLKNEGGTFSPFDASSKEDLKLIVPELNLETAADFVICSKCKDSLEESRKLKKIAAETDQFIKTQIDASKIVEKVNLNQIVKLSSDEAKSNTNSDSVNNENICRICLKNKEVTYMSMNKAKTDNLFSSALETCLSELDADLTANPVICEVCHNTLREMYSFKTVCLSVEEKLKRYSETTSEEKLDLAKVLTFLKTDSRKSLGDDNFLSEFEIKDEEEADIFDIFPNFSGETYENSETNKKRPLPDETSDVPAKKQKSVDSVQKPPVAEDELPHFAFGFNLIFNPRSEGTMEEWLLKVEEIKQKLGWSDYTTIHKVLVKLKGMDELYTWFSNISEIMNWDEWKKKLLQMFPATTDYYIKLKRMINRRKKPFENYVDYYNAKLKLLENFDITGEKAVSCLIGGVTDIAVGCIARVGNYKTPEELLDYFKTYNDKKPVVTIPLKKEDRVKEKTSNRVKGADNTSTGISDADKKADKKKRIKCYTCRKYGHTSKECWETFKAVSNGSPDKAAPTSPNSSKPGQKPRPRPRQKKRCTRCGKLGHGIQTCPNNRPAPVLKTPKLQSQQQQNKKPTSKAPQNQPRFRGTIEKKSGKTQQNQKNKNTTANTRCHNCGKMGHYQNACRGRSNPGGAPGGYANRGPSGGRSQEQSNERYFNRDMGNDRMHEDSSRIVCFKCFRVGHDARDCMEYGSRAYRT